MRIFFLTSYALGLSKFRNANWAKRISERTLSGFRSFQQTRERQIYFFIVPLNIFFPSAGSSWSRGITRHGSIILIVPILMMWIAPGDSRSLTRVPITILFTGSYYRRRLFSARSSVRRQLNATSWGPPTRGLGIISEIHLCTVKEREREREKTSSPCFSTAAAMRCWIHTDNSRNNSSASSLWKHFYAE